MLTVRVYVKKQMIPNSKNDSKWNENKAPRSKKIKSLLKQIGLGELWMKAHYADVGIVNMIRQRLKGYRATKMAE